MLCIHVLSRSLSHSQTHAHTHTHTHTSRQQHTSCDRDDLVAAENLKTLLLAIVQRLDRHEHAISGAVASEVRLIVRMHCRGAEQVEAIVLQLVRHFDLASPQAQSSS